MKFVTEALRDELYRRNKKMRKAIHVKLEEMDRRGETQL
jgi:hypothetical protein